MNEQSPGGDRKGRPTPSCTARAYASLALTKYWGKQPGGVNIPATGSLAVTVRALETETRVTVSDHDTVTIAGHPQPIARYRTFFDALRDHLRAREIAPPRGFDVVSTNRFPTAAGLASSASGFAALTIAAVGVAGGWYRDRSEAPNAKGGAPPHAAGFTDFSTLSSLARIGSGSAARSVFGGFTIWPAGAPHAEEYRPSDWWPDLRIVILPLHAGEKPISSRDAMNRTRDTSPYYAAWVHDAPSLFRRACDALDRRDLEALGEVMRLSYLRMFGTMLAAAPPVLYWRGETLDVLHHLGELRRRGIPAWETMDAGPQVKVLTTTSYVQTIRDEMNGWCEHDPIVSEVGPAPSLTTEPTT